MSLRRLSEAPAGANNGNSNQNGINGQNGQNPCNNPVNPANPIDSIMPMGPGVDASSILGPLIDGSFSQAQGQAAVMAGVRVPQGPGTIPIRGTNPLPTGTLPNNTQ